MGVRVDVNNEELKFCENSKKKWGVEGVGLGGGGQGGYDRRIEVLGKIHTKKNSGGGGGRVGGGGVRVDVKEELKFL